jgi:zinc D-Ala-D-Ala dipeptidase
MRKIIPLLLLVIACQAPKEDDAIAVEDLGPASFEVDESTIQSFDFSIEGDTLTDLDKRFLDAGLVNLQTRIPEVMVELRYSTTDNFFGQDVYEDLQNAYLQPEVVDMLEKAYLALQQRDPNLTLLVYDAVRPLSVQQILWDNLDKPEKVKPLYVADPKVGSLHNYGVAVDLTLADKTTGEPLDMGTHYDYFGYAAYPDREQQMLDEGKIKPIHIQNRQLLREVMKGAGFHGIGSEWWHFNAYNLQTAKSKYNIIK